MALELRPGAQELQEQNGFWALGAGDQAKGRHSVCHPLLGAPFTTQVRLILPDTRKGPAKHYRFLC